MKTPGNHWKLVSVLVASGTVGIVGEASEPAVPYEVIAYEGMDAPGQPAGVVLGTLDDEAPPTINQRGEVAFHAELEDTTDSFALGTDGIWTQGTGSLEIVAVDATAPPGIGNPAAFFDGLGERVLIDDTGHTAFNARWQDGEGNFEQGIWAVDAEGNVRNVAHTGMPAPGAPSQHRFEGFETPSLFLEFDRYRFLLGGGRVAFHADHVDDSHLEEPMSGSTEGNWSEGPNFDARQLSALAVRDVGAFGDIYPVSAINGLGRTVFRAQNFVDDDNPDNDFDAIWDEAGGTVLVVARSNTGDEGDFSFEHFSHNPSISDGGQSAFTATFEAPGDENSGIFKQQPQTAGGIAFEGTVAPGLSDLSGDGTPDFLFDHFGSDAGLVTNAGGTVAFFATASTPDNSLQRGGIWTDAGGSLTLVAKEGMAAPGLPAGTVIDRLDLQSKMVLNARDQIVYVGNFEAPDGTDGQGLWLWEDGETKLLLKSDFDEPGPEADVQADTFQLPNGETLLLSRFGFAAGGNAQVGSGNADGRPSGFSDNGEVVIIAREDPYSSDTEAVIKLLAAPPPEIDVVGFRFDESSDEVILEVSGTPDLTVSIERSTNLEDWTKLTSEQLEADGSLRQRLSVGSGPQEFFRVTEE